MQMAKRLADHRAISNRRWLLLGVALIGLYAVVPQLGSFHHSLQVIQTVRTTWLIVALLTFAGTYAAATIAYLLLAQRPLRPGATLLIQLASGFTNKLLPAGIGAIGINYQFLRRARHAASGAAAVVAMNNSLGFIGNMVWIAILFVTTNVQIAHLHGPHFSHRLLTAGAVVIVIALVILLTWRYRKLHSAVRHLMTHLKYYRRHKLRLLLALGVSMALTACFAITLYACAHALGSSLSPSQILLIMTLGVAGGTAVPTPGGLGGAEAGLVAGFVLYGTDSATALAIALLYRLLTYWLALLMGAIAFAYAERRQLL